MSGVLCDICGSNQFSSEGGFYYCSICNTQSQQRREYVEDEDQQIQRSRITVRTTVLGKKQQVTTRTRKTKDTEKIFLSSWETFNKIIKAMTEKLIDIGFPELLRDKVFQLWKTYLLKRDVVLRRTGSTDSDTRYTVVPGERRGNIRALYNWKLKRKLFKKKPENINTNKARRRLANKAKKKAFEAVYTQSQENDQLDEVMQPQLQKPTPVKMKLKPNAIALFEAMTPGIAHRMNRPSYISKCETITHMFVHENFTLTSVIILLFIACRQIGCRVLVSDFIRLICDGTLYITSIRGLELEDDAEETTKEVVSTNTLISSLTAGLNPTQMCQHIQSYLDFLGVKRFHFPRFSEFLPKFIQDCTLPMEFELLLSQLNQMYPESEDSRDLGNKVPPDWKFLIEIKTTAMIILMLRFLFGLDDYTERYQARFASKVNKVIDMAMTIEDKNNVRAEWSKLFDIQEWFQHIRFRGAFVGQEGFNPMSFLHGKPPNIARAHDISLRYAIEEDPGSQIITEDLLNLVDAESNPEISPRNVPSIKNLFQIAALAGNHGRIPEVPTYTSLPHPNLTMVEDFHRAKPDRVSYPQYDNELLYKVYHKRRVDYIFNPEKYIPLLEKAGYKVRVLPGTALLYQNQLRVKKRELLLFQPFKRIQESIEMTGSMQIVLDHMSTYVFYNTLNSKPVLGVMLKHLNRLYALRSRDGYIPITFS